MAYQCRDHEWYITKKGGALLTGGAGKNRTEKEGWKMNSKEFIDLIKDWRVALLIILVAASLIAIYPHFENGQLYNQPAVWP